MPRFTSLLDELRAMRTELKNTLRKKIPIVADEVQRLFDVLGLI
jgi:hypothetical protein